MIVAKDEFDSIISSSCFQEQITLLGLSDFSQASQCVELVKTGRTHRSDSEKKERAKAPQATASGQVQMARVNAPFLLAAHDVTNMTN